MLKVADPWSRFSQIHLENLPSELFSDEKTIKGPIGITCGDRGGTWIGQGLVVTKTGCKLVTVEAAVWMLQKITAQNVFHYSPLALARVR